MGLYRRISETAPCLLGWYAIFHPLSCQKRMLMIHRSSLCDIALLARLECRSSHTLDHTDASRYTIRDWVFADLHGFVSRHPENLVFGRPTLGRCPSQRVLKFRDVLEELS